MQNDLQIAVFGGGCFWCTEAIFQNLKGVMSVTSGYSGGHVKHPNYKQVSNGNTGHAEAVKIEYDPRNISYRTLLEVFFATHDPTAKNRQGYDIGEQYRSVIFYTSDEQKQTAQTTIQELTNSKADQQPIVTELVPLKEFYEAEDYHKNYYLNHPGQPYCRLVIDPKLAKLKEKYAKILKPVSKS